MEESPSIDRACEDPYVNFNMLYDLLAPIGVEIA